MHRKERIFSLENDPYIIDHSIEGIPFVPMAIVAEEFLSYAFPTPRTSIQDSGNGTGGEYVLRDFEIISPVMLRKNRPRFLQLSSETGRILLRDERENILARAQQPLFLHSNNSDTRLKYFQTFPDGGCFLFHRTDIYPVLFFHGPAFQGDFHIKYLTADRIILTVEYIFQPELFPLQSFSIFDPVLFDLSLQAAALHSVILNRVYVLPVYFREFSCNQASLFSPGQIHRKAELFVELTDRIEPHDSFRSSSELSQLTYTITIFSPFFMRIAGVRFSRLSKALSQEANILLEQILPSLKKMSAGS